MLFEMKCENILNVSITVLAFYLLFNEFSTFLVIKPTQTSLEHNRLTKEYFLVIIVCPEPAFNVTALKNEGYIGKWLLWNGNVSANLNRYSKTMKSFNFWGGKKNISQNKGRLH